MDHAHYFYNKVHGDDAYVIRELNTGSMLYAVMDGISTKEGSVAAKIIKKYLSYSKIENVGDLYNILIRANDDIYSTRSGTTFTAALVSGNSIDLLNSGDSPAYIIRNRKAEKICILDKIPYSLSAISGYAGIGNDFHIHKNNIKMKKGDRLILMTDGVSDNLYVEEIENIININNSAQLAIIDIKVLMENKRHSNTGIEDAFGYFKGDDATAIIVYSYS